MPAVEAIRRYADFAGRSTRSDYWPAFAIWWVAWICSGVIDELLFHDVFEEIGEAVRRPLGSIFFFATIVPMMALTARRHRDGVGSGWFAVIAVVPIIGWLIAFIVLPLMPSRPGPDARAAGSRIEFPSSATARDPDLP